MAGWAQGELDVKAHDTAATEAADEHGFEAAGESSADDEAVTLSPQRRGRRSAHREVDNAAAQEAAHEIHDKANNKPPH